MTAIEYVEKQLRKCEINLEKEIKRDSPQEVIDNIKKKIGYYKECIEALQLISNKGLVK